MMGMWKRFFENLGFWWGSGSTLFLSDSTKTPEMNELDIELSKKSKIIEIGSVEKKLRIFKVGGISKNSEISGFSYSNFEFSSKNCLRISKKMEIVKKFFDCFSFRFDALTIIFGIL